MYVIGLSDQENPFSFGTADPPVEIEWSISNADVADIKSTYHKVNWRILEGRGILSLLILCLCIQVTINPPARNNFAVRLITKYQGQVMIGVQVTDHEGNRFTDEIQLHVFERLKTKMTNEHGLSVLMTPNTETYIKTNR